MTSIRHTNERGYVIWLTDDYQIHRENGPAYELDRGYKEWWINGKRHRIDGPACEWEGGKQWWVDGKNITLFVEEMLSNSPFGEDIHLGILAEYFAERNDFRLLEIVQPYL